MAKRVLLYGKAGAGKTALAEELALYCQADVQAIADPIKEMVHKVFDWNEAYLWGPSEYRGVFPAEWDDIYGEISDQWDSALYRLHDYTRKYLPGVQDAFSEAFWKLKDEYTYTKYDAYERHESRWPSRALTARILCRAFGEAGRKADAYFWVRQVPNPPEQVEFQIVSDIRFPSEIAYLRSNSRATPIVVHVVDPDKSSADQDITETSMDNYDGWDVWQMNPKDGNLRDRARALLETLRTFK